MIATVLKQKLLKYLSYADAIASSKTTIPVLSNILIDASDDAISVQSSNLETGMRVIEKAKVSEQGALAVNGKKLLSIVRELPDDDVVLTTDEHNRLTVKSASREINAKFVIAGVSKADFPELKVKPETEYMQVNADEFKKMTKKVIFSISSDENKYSLTGVFLEKYDSGLNMVATDGKRLSFVSRRFADLGVQPDLFEMPAEGVIIPKIVLTEIVKYQFERDALRVGFSKNQIFFSYDNISVVSNLIEGKFPDYRKIIPEERERYFVAEKTILFSAIKRVSILVDESYNQIKLNISGGKLILSSKNPALGGAAEEIPIQYGGEAIDIALNYIYLLDCLKEVSSDDVKVDFENAERVLTVRGTGDSDYVNLIMPMKINV
jgi:DNA polymerase-3 subunit beta